jgi:hypothetical protein
VIDVQVRPEHVVNLVVAHAKGKKLVPPAHLAGEIEWWWMPFVFPRAGIY